MPTAHSTFKTQHKLIARYWIALNHQKKKFLINSTRDNYNFSLSFCIFTGKMHITKYLWKHCPETPSETNPTFVQCCKSVLRTQCETLNSLNSVVKLLTYFWNPYVNLKKKKKSGNPKRDIVHPFLDFQRSLSNTHILYFSTAYYLGKSRLHLRQLCDQLEKLSKNQKKVSH